MVSITANEGGFGRALRRSSQLNQHILLLLKSPLLVVRLPLDVYVLDKQWGSGAPFFFVIFMLVIIFNNFFQQYL